MIAEVHASIQVAQSFLVDGWGQGPDSSGHLLSYGDNYQDFPAPGGILPKN
jgi:hypothetical protein